MILKGRKAIITGASRGLGSAVAERFVQEGASVVLCARDGARLAQMETKLSAERRLEEQRVLCQPADVSQPDDVRSLVDTATHTLGTVDTLVCSAGVYGPMGLIESIDWDEWVAAVQINLLGVVLCCRAVLPLMKRQQSGKIVVLSGGGATSPMPRISAYAASKAAVVRFCETLAQEVAGDGIEVNTVAPGALNTHMLDELLLAGPEKVGQDVYARALQQRESGGASIANAAELIAFLASAASDGITGRLISAVWDDWRSLPEQRERLAKSDVFTLRRIVPQDRGW